MSDVELIAAIHDVVHAAYHVAEGTCEDMSKPQDERFIVDPDCILALNDALNKLEDLIPDERQPALPCHAVTMLGEVFAEQFAYAARLRKSLTWATDLIPFLLRRSFQELSPQGQENFNNARAELERNSHD
jgi:hypothetical protein